MRVEEGVLSFWVVLGVLVNVQVLEEQREQCVQGLVEGLGWPELARYWMIH